MMAPGIAGTGNPRLSRTGPARPCYTGRKVGQALPPANPWPRHMHRAPLWLRFAAPWGRQSCLQPPFRRLHEPARNRLGSANVVRHLPPLHELTQSPAPPMCGEYVCSSMPLRAAAISRRWFLSAKQLRGGLTGEQPNPKGARHGSDQLVQVAANRDNPTVGDAPAGAAAMQEGPPSPAANACAATPPSRSGLRRGATAIHFYVALPISDAALVGRTPWSARGPLAPVPALCNSPQATPVLVRRPPESRP